MYKAVALAPYRTLLIVGLLLRSVLRVLNSEKDGAKKAWLTPPKACANEYVMKSSLEFTLKPVDTKKFIKNFKSYRFAPNFARILRNNFCTICSKPFELTLKFYFFRIFKVQSHEVWFCPPSVDLPTLKFQRP